MRAADESRIRFASIALICFFVATLAWAVFVRGTTPGTEAPSSSGSTLREEDRMLGRSDAPILLFVYTDLECKYCKSNHQRTLPMLRREYTDGITFVYRHYPLPSRPKAYPEAIAAECAAVLGGNDAFWKYVDRIYAITPSDNGLDLALLDEVAATIGLDQAAFQECRMSDGAERRVQMDILEGSSLGVRTTPSIHVVRQDGKSILVSGDYPNRLRTAINALRNAE